jgi:hypothetical protein
LLHAADLAFQIGAPGDVTRLLCGVDVEQLSRPERAQLELLRNSTETLVPGDPATVLWLTSTAEDLAASGQVDLALRFLDTAATQANLADPKHPTLFSSTPSQGWGWMLDVQGDRAFVQSGWGSDGLDVYKLNADKAPTFEQTVRVRGWYTGALARQGNDVYLATGYWGTEHVTLK